MAKDFYSVLGVDKSASKQDIKKAFRAKAKEHHPDKGGDEAKFKEVNEAYEVLSDEGKKAQYDQFGSVGGGFGGGQSSGGQGFGGFEDMFSGGGGGFEDIFGSFFGGGRGQRQQASTRGSDLEVRVEISFEESLKGVSKKFPVTSYVSCEKCDAKGGEGKKTCSTCGGRGSVAKQFQTPLGVISQQTACPDCKGVGEQFEKTCSYCHGEGRREKKHTIEITIPQGVDDGETLVLKGKGDAGRQGGTAGDLYVRVSVRGSRDFVRRGLDVLTTLEIPVVDALLGGEFPVKTAWGEVVLTVPENTADRQMLRITGKGIKRGNTSGDHLVTLRYIMPKKISKKGRDKLEELKKVL